MNNSNTVTEQNIEKTNIGKSTYVTVEGIVKFCVAAPLLDLPIDFKEWYKPAGINDTQFHQI